METKAECMLTVDKVWSSGTDPKGIWRNTCRWNRDVSSVGKCLLSVRWGLEFSSSNNKNNQPSKRTTKKQNKNKKTKEKQSYIFQNVLFIIIFFKFMWICLHTHMWVPLETREYWILLSYSYRRLRDTWQGRWAMNSRPQKEQQAHSLVLNHLSSPRSWYL